MLGVTTHEDCVKEPKLRGLRTTSSEGKMLADKPNDLSPIPIIPTKVENVTKLSSDFHLTPPPNIIHIK